MEERLGLAKGRPLDHRAVARACFRLDPVSLVHGVFFARRSWPWQPRIARAVTSFIEASGVRPAVSGGVKRDVVINEAKGGATAEGYGTVPHHRVEYTAAEDHRLLHRRPRAVPLLRAVGAGDRAAGGAGRLRDRDAARPRPAAAHPVRPGGEGGSRGTAGRERGRPADREVRRRLRGRAGPGDRGRLVGEGQEQVRWAPPWRSGSRSGGTTRTRGTAPSTRARRSGRRRRGGCCAPWWRRGIPAGRTCPLPSLEGLLDSLADPPSYRTPRDAARPHPALPSRLGAPQRGDRPHRPDPGPVPVGRARR